MRILSSLALSSLAALVLAGCAQASVPAANPSAHSTSPAASAHSTSPAASASTPGTSSSAPNKAELDNQDTAGWYTKLQAGTLVGLSGTFALTAADLSTDGALGIQLCNSHTGYAVQFGAIPVKGGWRIGSFTGKLSSATGIGGSPCVGNQFLRQDSVTTLGAIPAGASVHTQI